MQSSEIQFDDGAAYERFMGVWSQQAGKSFLQWLSPPTGQRCLDVGCGNGAFTELLASQCAPKSIDGVDPSAEQLAFARTRPALRTAQWHQGHAMELPFASGAFDLAVMPLVIFFVPDPAKGVSEMVRVVRAGGVIAAYAWDMPGGGFPYHSLWTEMETLGAPVNLPPSPDASRIDEMRRLWTAAGLNAIETREISVQRTFADFEDYWSTAQSGPSVKKKLSEMSPQNLATLKNRMRERHPAGNDGTITTKARANAVKGRVG